jgi:hypothetical protein
LEVLRSFIFLHLESFRISQYNSHPDGVIYKFSLNGERIWATYYGEQIDEIYAVQVDDEDNIYLGGQTTSNFNMTT